MTEKNKCLVVGATGVVGSFIANKLEARNIDFVCLSRHQSGGRWIRGDLNNLSDVSIPKISTVYVTSPISLLAKAMPYLTATGVTRLAALSTTSVTSKIDSTNEDERKFARQILNEEQQILEICHQNNIQCSILRPTIIYCEGRDANVTKIANLIRKLRFFPMSGAGNGLRQPIHAEDLADACIASASATPGVYNVAGGEVVTYYEMVGKIFDALQMQRLILKIPPPVWRAFLSAAKSFIPNVTAEMGDRMSKDMIFDIEKAKSEFSWSPRRFVLDFSNL